MKNLWPEQFSVPDEYSPKQLLEEQASLLTKITKGMVDAEVSSVTTEYAEKIFGVRNPFNFQLTIIGPFIDNYKHRVLRISHSIPMHPVLVAIDDSIGVELGIECGPYGSIVQVPSAAAFESLVASVLQSKRIQAIIGTILTLST